MSWAAGTLYGFDVESTGVDVFNDRIVTATVVKVEAGKATDKRSWLINPAIQIPQGAIDIHGVTNEKAAGGADPAVAVGEIAEMVTRVMAAGFPLIAFNAAFDLSILQAESVRHNLPTLHQLVDPDQWHTVVDPMVLGQGLDMVARKFVRGRKYTLVALCERFKVPFAESHDATADATGAVLLARAIAKSEKHLADMGPAQLHQLQKTWRREKMLSLAAYFDREGIEHDVDPSWPLHTRLMVGANV